MPTRAELISKLVSAGADNQAMVASMQQAVCERLGLNATAVNCLTLLSMPPGEQPMTAGHLAETIGLTTGAVTGLIDRLESAGYVRRQRDPSDRRRVIIEAVPERITEIDAVYEPIVAAYVDALEKYTKAELAVILDFIERIVDVYHEQAERIRDRI